MLICYSNEIDENNRYLHYPNVSRVNHSWNPIFLFFTSSNIANDDDNDDDA